MLRHGSSMIHVIDNSTRTPFLTFLPFLLIAKGSSVPGVGRCR